MSCSQCYTVQVPECIEFLEIYTSLIDVPDNMDIGIKIVNNHGNVRLYNQLLLYHLNNLLL